MFIAFKEHFIDEIDWRHTQFYKNTVAAINKKRHYWGCESEQDFLERCLKLDDLLKGKTNGHFFLPPIVTTSPREDHSLLQRTSRSLCRSIIYRRFGTLYFLSQIQISVNR